MFTYTNTTGSEAVMRSDGALIPFDTGNTDYQIYLEWVAQGNAAASIPAPTAAQQWTQYQAAAQAALTASDSTILRCVENGVAIPPAWVTYRKQLRAIVGAASGDATQPAPVRPAFPAGT